MTDSRNQYMKLLYLITGLLALGATLVPSVCAAPHGHLKHTGQHHKKKRTPHKKSTCGPRPELPRAGSEFCILSAPQGHAESYKKFIEKLNEQVKNNDIDTCSAMTVALTATGDEFCLEQWMEKAAAEGNPVALHYMGMTSAAKNSSPEIRYLNHEQRQALINSQRHLAQQAASWLKRAADRRYVPAMLDYSVFLRNGIGVLKNEQAANRLLLEASKTGNMETRFSWLLQEGRLMCWADRERPEVAAEIERGNHHVIYRLSQFAPDSRTQLEWLQKAITKGNGAAAYSLSAVMSKTAPVESFKLLKAAVAMHDSSAMFVYGSFLVNEPGEYHKQTGLEQNVELGVAMLRLSAMMGNSQSRRALAKSYYRGEYALPRDLSKCYAHLKWLNSAQRDPISMAAQGFMLLTGEGVKQDIDTGLRYITLAANANYSYAAAMLAYARYKGIGTQRDPAQAVEMLQEAAAAGFAHAYVYIAFLTAKGLHGAAPDLQEAKRYINIAAINLGDSAKLFFDQLMQETDWELAPFPLEKKSNI